MTLLNQLHQITDWALLSGPGTVWPLYNHKKRTSRKKNKIWFKQGSGYHAISIHAELLSSYSMQSDTSVWNATDIIIFALHLDWHPHCPDIISTGIYQSSRPFSITSGDLLCIFPSVSAFLLITGPQGCVFGFSAAAYTLCSEAEVIMWVTSQLRLEGVKECKHTGWG